MFHIESTKFKYISTCFKDNKHLMGGTEMAIQWDFGKEIHASCLKFKFKVQSVFNYMLLNSRSKCGFL